MSQLRFLVDENAPEFLVDILRASEPSMDLIKVGEPGAPPFQTRDPQLLIFAERSGRCLVSLDRKSMPRHLKDHFAAGHHTCGVILMRRGFPTRDYVQDLLLIWHAETADEWIDRTDYIPY